MRVIYGGDEAIDALLFGIPNPANADFFRRQIEEVRNFGSEAGQRFYESSMALYDRFHNSNALAIARAALNQTRGIFRPDIIQTLNTIDDLQIAGHQMQRWNMANPVIRARYHAQQCDGYSDSYVDTQPGAIGEEHYDYRRVMNGHVEVTETSWEAKIYAEELKPGDQELEPYDRHSIRDTWISLERAMSEAARDPTSPWNSSL